MVSYSATTTVSFPQAHHCRLAPVVAIQQLAAVMRKLKAAREAKGLSLADIYERTGMDRSALSKLENVTNENPTIDTLLRYAEVVGKRLQIQVVDS